MTDPTTPDGGTPPPTRSPAFRWLPWIAVLAAAALLFVLVRPSSDDDGDAADTSSEETTAEDAGSADTSPEETVGDTSAGDTAETAGSDAGAEGCDERQLASSEYGPCKVEPFTGDNGGATSPGVTEDTITLSYRLGSSTQMASLNALAGDAASSLGSSQDEVLEDVTALVDYFNDQFELYGRRVELEVFEGQGDFVAEFQSTGVQAAQIDATRAKDMGAFADISLLTQTQPYAEALMATDIISMGAVYASEGWYADHAPFAYGGPWPMGTRMAEYAGNIVCERLAGEPAVYGADEMASELRKFGLVYTDVPEWSAAADVFEETVENCGESITRRLSFALDILSMQGETTNTVAQLKEAGVTTVVCICDEFSPLFLTSAAFTQEYDPEWFMLRWPDPWGRLTAQDQFARAMQSGGAVPVLAESEIGTVLAEATGSPQAASPSAIPLAYEQLLLMFSALQEAGPDLTPETFQAGYGSIPPTEDGVLGPWEFGAGVFSPKSSFQLGWWSPDIESNLDGIAGSVQDCGAGAWHRFDDVEGLRTEGTSLECFG